VIITQNYTCHFAAAEQGFAAAMFAAKYLFDSDNFRRQWQKNGGGDGGSKMPEIPQKLQILRM
jgi:hypothetical protein